MPVPIAVNLSARTFEDPELVDRIQAILDHHALSPSLLRVELGHALDLTVVAEGVENEYLLARLRSLGVDLAQGYLIARPLPAGELAAWKEAYTPPVDRRSGHDRRGRLEIRPSARERRSWSERRRTERPVATVAPV